MANEHSIKTMRARKDQEQVSFLMPKGGRALVRALALKYNTTISALLRYAVLVLAGLNEMPPAEETQPLAAVETVAEAGGAIAALQNRCYKKSNDKYAVALFPDEWENFWDVADLIESAIAKQNMTIAKQGIDAPGLDHIEIELPKTEITDIIFSMIESDPRMPHKEELE